MTNIAVLFGSMLIFSTIFVSNLSYAGGGGAAVTSGVMVIAFYIVFMFVVLVGGLCLGFSLLWDNMKTGIVMLSASVIGLVAFIIFLFAS